MGEPELVDELAVRAGLLERVEVGALDILDERQLELLAAGCLADDRRDAREAGELRSANPTLAGDQAIPLERLGHEHRLQDSVGGDAGAKLVKLIQLEHRPRLVRVPLDSVDRDLGRHWRRGGRLRDECSETATQ